MANDHRDKLITEWLDAYKNTLTGANLRYFCRYRTRQELLERFRPSQPDPNFERMVRRALREEIEVLRKGGQIRGLKKCS